MIGRVEVFSLSFFLLVTLLCFCLGDRVVAAGGCLGYASSGQLRSRGYLAEVMTSQPGTAPLTVKTVKPGNTTSAKRALLLNCYTSFTSLALGYDRFATPIMQPVFRLPPLFVAGR